MAKAPESPRPIRAPSYLDAAIPLLALVALVAASVALFGLDAVAGPMQPMTVLAWGFPAIPTRLRTVELLVNRTASKPPVLIASRISAEGGAARTVR